MKTPIIYLTAVLAAATPWWNVQAQQTTMPDRGPMAFEVYDQNGDGVITADEFAEARNQRIRERASAGYPMRGLQQQGAPSFEAFDRNGDGQLTREELQAGQMERWQQQREQRWQNRQNRVPGAGGRGGGMGGGGMGGGGTNN